MRAQPRISHAANTELNCVAIVAAHQHGQAAAPHLAQFSQRVPCGDHQQNQHLTGDGDCPPCDTCMCVCCHLVQVVSLDAQAAYQLCAVAGKSLLLWDLRTGPAAAASLPLQAPPAVVRAMPGGQVLLSAEGSGQVGRHRACVVKVQGFGGTGF